MTQFKGRMTPYQPRRVKTPVWETKQIAGKRGDVYSIFRIWIYGASVDYPSVGVNIGISNGAGSAFTQVTPDEFKSFMAFLKDAEDQIIQRLPKLEADAEALKQAAHQTENLMRAMQAMQNGSQYSDPDFPAQGE